MGWGGVPTGAGLVDGGVDQGPCCRRGLGGGGAFQRRGRGKGWLAWQFHRRGQGLAEESKGFGSGRVGVLFFESWRVDLVTCSRRRFALCCLGVREGGPQGRSYFCRF